MTSTSRLRPGPASALTFCLLASGLATAAPEASGPDFAAQVRATLGLRAGTVFSLDLEAEIGQPLVTLISIDGLPAVLHLEPYSVRSARYQVLAQSPDGTLVPVEPAPVRTMRGSLLGFEGSLAAGSWLENGLHAVIHLPGAEAIWIEPLAGRVAGAEADRYVLYRSDDVIIEGGFCGANDMLDAALLAGDAVADRDAPPAGAGGLCVAELACDADVEYFQDYGSVANVEARINSVINTVDVQYQRDVGIDHSLGTIIVRTQEPDPYGSTDAVTLLNQFRNQWLNNHGNVQRDVAQLFTGKEIDGGTIGIAWLNAVCTSFGFGVVQSDFNSNFACATDLSAHELGHNWGADHCSCTSYTMNPFITCANQFHPTFSIPEIVSFRDSRTCLDCGGGPPTGACCIGELCSIATQSACEGGGGTYQGDGTDCSPDPCAPDPTGACCIGELCSIATQSACEGGGGTYQGDGTDCSPDPCAPDPTGACCIGELCSIATQSACEGGGGTYQGDGTDCSPDPCDTGGPLDAPPTCVAVTTGTGSGTPSDVDGSDNVYVTVASSGGRKHRTRTEVCADSPIAPVATMTLRVETGTSTSGVKTTISLQRAGNNKWTRVASFTQSQSDSARVINVSDPNRFVTGSGAIRVRIQSDKRGAHTLRIDHVEITVE